MSDGTFLDPAKALPFHVSPEDIAESAVFPQLSRIRRVSHAVACSFIERAVSEGTPTLRS